jgi:diguanylate cyclase (GGDEF)-like protein/PAS domain S-box-containing protein
MSLGLVFITMTVLVLSNLIGLIPDKSRVAMESRKSTAESLAVRCTYAARDNNVLAIKKTMEAILKSKPDILSLGMRSTYGKYLAQTAEHHMHWTGSPVGGSTFNHWQVPIYNGEKKWATLEISFAPKDGFAVMGYNVSPFALLLAFFAAISFTGFMMFMRRSLRYLDPSSVMPSRVKHALDTLTEGVLLIDTKERIILANSVFIEKLGCTVKELLGLKASQLNWVDHETNKAPEVLPWIYAMSKGDKQSGALLDIHTKAHGIRTFVVNSAPILDDKQKSRGAVLTFDDVTDLEQQSFQLSRMVELLQMSRDKINLKNKEINQKNKELEILATQDSLSGCLNRRAFFIKSTQYLTVSMREDKSLACIMMDIDEFKSVNDTYGHIVGDQVIRYIAHILKGTVKGDDIVCRYGGEEFCILLPNCNIEDAAALAEKIRTKIAEESVQDIAQAPDLRVSASFGVSDAILGASSIEELLAQADRALYKAKGDGRNRVVLWDSVEENTCLQQAAKG